jgi:hypothetical protein
MPVTSFHNLSLPPLGSQIEGDSVGKKVEKRSKKVPTSGVVTIVVLGKSSHV